MNQSRNSGNLGYSNFDSSNLNINFVAGHFNFGGKSYWISWASNEQALRNARWNWFTGRNYCRKVNSE